MLVALTVWNGRISPVCDVARQLLVFEVEGGKVIDRRYERMEDADCWQRAAHIQELKPDTLICGAISGPLAGSLAAKGIRIVPFISGVVEEVLAAYLNGTLLRPAFAMPGCYGRGGRFGGVGGRRGRGACFGGRRMIV
jgi:predicted Fe-Mo cluster-binding NifX family protein